MSVRQRRVRLVARHLLDGSGSDLTEAARALVVLHATDPATVYLSALSRVAGATLADVSKALYEDRSLVRLMAMRRTLFVAPTESAAMIHHAASLDVAATMRKRLLKQLATLPTEPVLPTDPAALAAWLTSLEDAVEQALVPLGSASGAQLSAAEPRLRTAILPATDKKYDVKRYITSQVLVLMGAEGRLVRQQPLGSWTSRQHTWASGRAWWPDGIPEVPAARVGLVEQYLRRFGPVTETDVAWWTGWPLGVTRKAIAALETAPLDGGIVLAEDTASVVVMPPTAALLPALDPTPMGWKERDWFLPEDSRSLYDTFGNIGPTVWWDGEIIGGWAVRPDGSINVRLLVDRGVEASRSVAEATAALQPRLEGAVVVPTFRTPLERELSRD